MINILILEDSEERIIFLKKKLSHFGLTEKVNIIWKTQVNDFEIWMNENKNNPPDMIVLDHDLDYDHYVCSGHPSYGKTTYSVYKNGSDAAKKIEWKDVPVIIWSMNPVGADNIHLILEKKDIKSVKLLFGTKTVNSICKMINSLLAIG